MSQERSSPRRFTVPTSSSQRSYCRLSNLVLFFLFLKSSMLTAAVILVSSLRPCSCSLHSCLIPNTSHSRVHTQHQSWFLFQKGLFQRERVGIKYKVREFFEHFGVVYKWYQDV